jgi:hypothetical protein
MRKGSNAKSKSSLLVALVLSFALQNHFAHAAAPLGSQDNNTIIFAHYMHCYVLGSTNANDVRVKNVESIRDLSNWPPQSEESEWFSPELSRISASGSAATLEDFHEAESIGVDDFGILLGFKALPKSQFAPALDLIASVAQTQKVKLIPEMWADPWQNDYEFYGKTIKSFMDRHKGAFQLRDGKPILVFEFDNVSKHESHLGQAIAYQQLNQFLAPWGGSKNVYLVMYIPWQLATVRDSPLFQEADALDIWLASEDWSDLRSNLSVSAAEASNKASIFPVAPAFYQRRAGGPPMEYANTFGAAKYIDLWISAIKLKAKFVDIQTWNDFSEDTAIECSNLDGNVLLHLTDFFSTWLRHASEPAIYYDRAMLLHPKQLSRAKLKVPNELVKNYFWRHKTPIVDYLDCVLFLKEAAQVTVSIGTQSWTMTVPSGFHEWIIYSTRSVFSWKSDQVSPNMFSYPQNRDFRSVTAISEMPAGIPEVEIERNGKSILSLRSRLGYLNSGTFQDFSVIGDEVTSSY